MIASVIFEIAVLVFIFLILSIGLTIYEFKMFILKKHDQSTDKKNK